MAKRSTAPTIPGEVDDLEPDPMDYDPKKVAKDAEALKDFLLWSRRQGITFQVATFGTIQITNVVDHYPRAKVRGRSKSEETGPLPDVDDFATPEERALLEGHGSGDEDDT